MAGGIDALDRMVLDTARMLGEMCQLRMTELPKCLMCKAMIVERDDVEKLVTGKLRFEVARKYMRVCLYRNATAYVYSGHDFELYSGISPHRKATTVTRAEQLCFAKCNCDAALDEPSRVIREEYREAYLGKFGGHLTVPWLLQMPVEMVAWENIGLLRVDASGVVVVGDQGKLLSDVICEMAEKGQFNNPSKRACDVEQFLSDYSYLHAVKPAYRPLVAMQLGNQATVKQMFQLDSDFVDWRALLMVSGRMIDGKLQLSGQFRLPNEEALLRAMTPEDADLARTSVTRDSSLTKYSTVVRPLADPGETHPGTIVYLTEGECFLPKGEILVDVVEESLVMLEPEARVTIAGTTVDCDRGPVALWLKKPVSLILHAANCSDDNFCLCQRARNEAANHAVAVRVECISTRKRLAEWLIRQFDPFDQSGRFAAKLPLVVVYSAPVTTPLVEIQVANTYEQNREPDAELRYEGFAYQHVFKWPTGAPAVKLKGPLMSVSVHGCACYEGTPVTMGFRSSAFADGVVVRKSLSDNCHYPNHAMAGIYVLTAGEKDWDQWRWDSDDEFDVSDWTMTSWSCTALDNVRLRARGVVRESLPGLEAYEDAWLNRVPMRGVSVRSLMAIPIELVNPRVIPELRFERRPSGVVHEAPDGKWTLKDLWLAYQRQAGPVTSFEKGTLRAWFEQSEGVPSDELSLGGHLEVW